MKPRDILIGMREALNRRDRFTTVNEISIQLARGGNFLISYSLWFLAILIFIIAAIFTAWKILCWIDSMHTAILK